MLAKIWEENELAVLARSQRACEETAALVRSKKPEAVFSQLVRVYRQPSQNWNNAARHIWQELQADNAEDHSEFEKLFLTLADTQHVSSLRESLRLWLWRRVVRSGKQHLIESRFFADAHLFHRTLQEDRLVLWYGSRVAEWPIQLLLALFLGGREHTQRLRLQLCWPTASLPADFVASRPENRTLRRLWEARILVRFGQWAHLHPSIMLLLPEVSSFNSPVFEWQEHKLVAHMQDGRIWPVQAFNLAALFFDEALALFGRDRGALWRNLVAYAESYRVRPEDVASQFVLQCFEDWGLHGLREAEPDFLQEFAESICFLNDLRRLI